MPNFLGSQDVIPQGWVCAGSPGPQQKLKHSPWAIALTPELPPGCLGAPVLPAALVPVTSAGFGAAQCPPPLLPCGFPPFKGVQDAGFAAASLCQGVWGDS